MIGAAGIGRSMTWQEKGGRTASGVLPGHGAIRLALMRTSSYPRPDTCATAPGSSTVTGRAVRPGSRRRIAGRLLGSSLLPAVLMGAAAVAVLLRYDVAPRDLLAFTAYLLLCLALPGVLLVRALWPARRTAAEEIALGLALGYAVEVLVYIAARAAGHPLSVLAWPAATYALFLGVPRLRRHWRRPQRRPAPLWWSWALALVMFYLLALGVLTFLGKNAIAWPAMATSYIDMPYHLALVGELRAHMPPTVPAVAGEPLFYHWFVYAHLAAAGWVTGIDPVVLLFRLGMPPMMAAITVLFGMVGRRVTGSYAGSLVALAGTVLMTAPNLYHGVNVGTLTWRGFQSWTGPSQTFGALLFAPVVLLAIDLSAARRRDPLRMLVFCVFVLAVMGAKATYLPPFAFGLALVAGVRLVTRRPRGPVLAMLGVTAICWAYAQFVLFGGARQAMIVAPLSLLERAWGELTGRPGAAVPVGSLLGITVVYLLCLAVTWCGALGLLARPRLLLRPAVMLLLGMGVACVGAALVFGHPHLGQLYFFGAGYPYLMMVAAYGLVTVVRRAAVTPRTVGYAVVAGVGGACLVWALCGVRTPLPPGGPEGLLYLPYAVLAAAAGAAAVVVVLTRRGVRAWAVVLVAFAAAGWPAAWSARVLSTLDRTPPGATSAEVAPVEPGAVPDGFMTAARWLRAHSSPGDLVATNVHCRWGHGHPCDSRQFWVSALAERRVLVEGWTYTGTNMSRWRPGELPELLPFWDGERLRANDAAFTAPSRTTTGLLRDRYGVRWLLADERYASRRPGLGAVAELRFRSGDCAVYHLGRRAPGVTSIPERAT